MNKLKWLAQLKHGDSVVLVLDNGDKYHRKIRSIKDNGHMLISDQDNEFVGGECRIGIDENYNPAYFTIEPPDNHPINTRDFDQKVKQLKHINWDSGDPFHVSLVNMIHKLVFSSDKQHE